MQLLTLHPGTNSLAGECLDDRIVDHPVIESFYLTAPQMYGRITSDSAGCYHIGDFVDWLLQIGFKPAPLGGFTAEVTNFGVDAGSSTGFVFTVKDGVEYVDGLSMTYTIDGNAEI